MSESPEYVLIPENYLKGECNWVPIHNKTVPGNAQCGARTPSGEPMIIARLRIDGECLPGYVLPSTGLCYSSSGDRPCKKGSYEVLVSSVSGEFEWVAASNGGLADGAVVGGLASGDELLYIGRVKLESGHKLGKIQPSLKGCTVVIDDVPVTFPDYKVLACRCPSHLKTY